MSNTSRALEITVISGEGLRVDRRRPVKKNAFVTIRSDSKNEQSTRLDTEGGSYPEWNEKLVVDMPVQSRFLTVEVVCKTYGGEKAVGGARIPVTDFIGGYTPENYLHFLSYRLRDHSGERNGIINLSVRVKGATAESGGVLSYARPWTGYPVAEKVSGGGGVVTGVPVWQRY